MDTRLRICYIALSVTVKLSGAFGSARSSSYQTLEPLDTRVCLLHTGFKVESFVCVCVCVFRFKRILKMHFLGLCLVVQTL